MPAHRSSAASRQQELFPEAIRLEQATTFLGPLPPPDLLAEYDQVHPGLAERIVRMAEKEGEHRRGLQSRAMRLSEGGLISAFLLSAFVLGGGFLLTFHDRNLAGMSVIFAGLSALLTVYLTRGRKRSEKVSGTDR